MKSTHKYKKYDLPKNSFIQGWYIPEKTCDGLVKYFDKSWHEFGPVSSVQALYKKNGGLDDEAPKKAMTDAMTKAFSHLGVSADVFLGLFDNNKYVEEMTKKFETPVNIKVVNVKELKNDKQSNASGTTGSRSRNQTN